MCSSDPELLWLFSELVALCPPLLPATEDPATSLWDPAEDADSDAAGSVSPAGEPRGDDAVGEAGRDRPCVCRPRASSVEATERRQEDVGAACMGAPRGVVGDVGSVLSPDRKSTRLNSSHS